MTGQDAVNSASEFNERLELDGVILTKFDSDARGGAALSVKAVTGKPIKFIGVGEKLDKLEEFHPDRMAGRILGMGDVVSLVEKAQQEFDAGQAAKLQEKMAKGKFTLDDFLGQIKQMQKIGPLKEILKLMPGMGEQIERDADERRRAEQHGGDHPLHDAGRARGPRRSSRRAAAAASPAAAAREPQDVSGLVKSFSMAAGMMKQMAGMGLKDRAAFAKQMGQMGMSGMMPRFKVKQRSHRLTKKERERLKKKSAGGRVRYHAAYG